jgi:hypothetical protein
VIEQLGLWGGFILTLMVFSYVLGDNVLYRLAIYAFVGLVGGFVAIAAVEGVLLPWLRAALFTDDPSARIAGIILLAFGGLLLLRAAGRAGVVANIPLGYLIGVGSAVAVVGAVSGTLLPLSRATAGAAAAGLDDPGALLNALLLVIGVVCTLVWFQYAARRTPGVDETRRGAVVRALSGLGQGVLALTFGVLYGGAILSGLVIFSERIAYLLARVVGG